MWMLVLTNPCTSLHWLVLTSSITAISNARHEANYWKHVLHFVASGIEWHLHSWLRMHDVSLIFWEIFCMISFITNVVARVPLSMVAGLWGAGLHALLGQGREEDTWVASKMGFTSFRVRGVGAPIVAWAVGVESSCSRIWSNDCRNCSFPSQRQAFSP